MYLILFLILTVFMRTAGMQNDDSILLNSGLMKTENQWSIINDGVMGGLSSSKVIINDSTIVFSGNVSLKNNGGFASLRSPIKEYNFGKSSGIEVKIKGDGKRYSVLMKETDYFNGYFYQRSFETINDEWIVIRIPFKDFKLHYFGYEANTDKEVPYNSIKEISLLIGDKQEGSFKSEIGYIKLY